MNKRIASFVSLLLCCCLSISLALPARAAKTTKQQAEDSTADLTISSVEEFLAFAGNCRLDSYSSGLTVSLEADIDLRDTGFSAIPTFSGTFNGNSHSISGLQLTAAGSTQGLFRYLTKTAVVQDLTVVGQVAPQGSRSNVGALAGSNAGRILNCRFSGQVSGLSNVGGLVGVNTVSGVIDGCLVSGTVSGAHFVGGVAGESRGVIRNCANTANINTTPQQNSVELSDITLDTLTNAEAANTVTDIGGIAGTCSGVIRNCSNRGDVGYRQMGYNIGGIAGSLTGYIYGCENHGEISGRKEVGGVVGQMEPVTNIQYTTDTLEILQSQLNSVSGLTDQAVANTQGSASNLGSYMDALGDQAGNAMDAMGQLSSSIQVPDISIPTLPELETPGLEDALPEFPDLELPEWDGTLPELPDAELPDLEDLENHLPNAEEIPSAEELLSDASDRLSAARNSLNSSITQINNTVDNIRDAQSDLNVSLSGMGSALDGLGSSAQGMTDSLNRDMENIAAQLEKINTTLNNADANLGGSFTDVSDQDTARDTTSKVDSCANYGAVLADWNAGGIAGAMSFENDLDPDDTLQVSGSSSLHFVGELRTVISNCENSAAVTAKKQRAGGIVGYQYLGLVKNSLNTGRLDAAAADYVGGVAGQSGGTIRTSSAKCEVSGSAYVGGIAGSGVIVTDCRSMVILLDTEESTGAILGMAEESRTGEKTPIQGNYYLPVGEDPGAIDGINYDGCAVPLEFHDFLALEGLDTAFQSVTLTLLADGEPLRTYAVTPGTPLSGADIPEPPAKKGYLAHWDGLDAISTGFIYFDRTLQAVYTALDDTIQSAQAREDGRPILLLQGTFTPEALLTLTETEDAPVPMSRQSLVEAWSFRLPEGEAVTGGRYLPPEGYDENGAMQVLVRGGVDEDWREVNTTENASYLVFDLEEGDNQFAVIYSEPTPWLLIGAILGGIALVCLLVWRICSRKQNKKTDESAGEITAENESEPAAIS